MRLSMINCRASLIKQYNYLPNLLQEVDVNLKLKQCNPEQLTLSKKIKER